MKTAKKSFAYLVLILGALIMVLPFFWMIISSLKTAAEVNTTPPTFWPKELVFENYVYAFEKAPFLRYFCNSLLVTIVCVACTMFTTILAAFAFSRLKFPGRDLLFSLLLSLMMIPFEMLINNNFHSSFCFFLFLPLNASHFLSLHCSNFNFLLPRFSNLQNYRCSFGAQKAPAVSCRGCFCVTPRCTRSIRVPCPARRPCPRATPWRGRGRGPSRCSRGP
ncbi:MAG: carbohydrate ABC transporter permease [Oscillospiraceae bacterium]